MGRKDLGRRIKRGAKRFLGLTRMFGNIRYYWVASLQTSPAQTMAKRLRAKGETIRITPMVKQRESSYPYWDVWRKQH